MKFRNSRFLCPHLQIIKEINTNIPDFLFLSKNWQIWQMTYTANFCKWFTNISKCCVRSHKALSIPALCPCARWSPRRAAEPGGGCSKIWNKNPNWSFKWIEMFYLLHSRFAGQSLSLLHFLETKKSFSRIDFFG